MKNWGIRTRVLLLALCPAVAIALLLSGYMAYRVSAEFELDLRNYGFGLSRQLAALAEFSTYSGDNEALRRLIHAALNESLVNKVSVLDREGKPIVSNGPLPARITSGLPTDRPLVLGSDDDTLRFAAPILPSRYESDDPLVDAPVRHDRAPATTVIGWILLDLSSAPTQARKYEASFFAVLSTLFVLVLGGLVARLLARQVVQPILRLEEAVSRIQAGQDGVRVPANSGGDLQRLEEGMNAMAEALDEKREFLEARVRIATHKLEQKMNEAERSSLAKSRFLAAASHDLRQPLHALSLFAADLRHATLNPEQQRLVRQINASVHGISALLDALLDISRLDVAGVAPTLINVPVSKLFGKLMADFSHNAELKGLSLRCRPGRYRVRSDPVLLERLLGNLLANAIRYTPSGHVLLTARKRGQHVRIEVRDSGIGIAQEYHEDIFDKFFQVGNNARAEGQGLGLGLAIVRRLAKALSVSVELRSAPGCGSCFSLTLPLAGRESASAEDDSLPHDEPDGLPQLVLVRSPHAALQEAAFMAGNWGFHGVWVDAFDEALEKARHADLIVVCASNDAVVDRLELKENQRVRLIAIGQIAGRPGGRIHTLPLPLRPAKLRALLTQMLPPTA